MNACWLHEKALFWSAESQDGLPAYLQRHLAGCARCRTAYESQARVAHDLRLKPESQLTELPPFLHARIMSGLKSSAPASISLTGWSAVRAVLVPAFGVLTITAFFWWIRQEPPRSAAISPPAQTAAPSNPAPDPDQIVAWIDKMPQPLERELASVVKDGKTALRSIAGNFLPDPPRPDDEF
jgi:hypothetical protein